MIHSARSLFGGALFSAGLAATAAHAAPQFTWAGASVRAVTSALNGSTGQTDSAYAAGPDSVSVYASGFNYQGYGYVFPTYAEVSASWNANGIMARAAVDFWGTAYDSSYAFLGGPAAQSFAEQTFSVTEPAYIELRWTSIGGRTDVQILDGGGALVSIASIEQSQQTLMVPLSPGVSYLLRHRMQARDGDPFLGSFSPQCGWSGSLVARTPTCAPDLTTTGTTNGVPDGVVNGSDFTYYLSLFAAASPMADLTTTGSANGVPDGIINGSDFTYYLSLFATGCP